MCCVCPSLSLRPFFHACCLGALYLGALYTVRLAVLNLNGLWVLLRERLGLVVPNMADTVTNATSRYRGHSHMALTSTTNSKNHLKGDMLHYSTVTRSVDLVWRP